MRYEVHHTVWCTQRLESGEFVSLLHSNPVESTKEARQGLLWTKVAKEIPRQWSKELAQVKSIA